MIEKISFEKAKEILDSVPEAVLIDVREEEEYAVGHAVDAELLPVDSITSESAMTLLSSRSTPVLLYCRTGARSAVAAKKLEALGYETIYDIGGLSGWPYGLVG